MVLGFFEIIKSYAGGGGATFNPSTSEIQDHQCYTDKPCLNKPYSFNFANKLSFTEIVVMAAKQWNPLNTT